jgi:hypothetical protein
VWETAKHDYDFVIIDKWYISVTSCKFWSGDVNILIRHSFSRLVVEVVSATGQQILSRFASETNSTDQTLFHAVYVAAYQLTDRHITYRTVYCPPPPPNFMNLCTSNRVISSLQKKKERENIMSKIKDFILQLWFPTLYALNVDRICWTLVTACIYWITKLLNTNP